MGRTVVSDVHGVMFVGGCESVIAIVGDELWIGILNYKPCCVVNPRKYGHKIRHCRSPLLLAITIRTLVTGHRLVLCLLSMASGSCVRMAGKRTASASWSHEDRQTSTRKAAKRQSRLPYKKQRVSVNVGKNAAAAETSKAIQNVMDVDPVTKGGNVDPSFNCWQTDSADGGHVRTEKNGTPTSVDCKRNSHSVQALGGECDGFGVDVDGTEAVCRDKLIVWDGGENGIQVHFTDIKDLVQGNSIHGNVIDAYGAMLTDMHRTVSGKEEYQGAAYVYSSVCADMMRNTSAVSQTKYLNVYTKAARGSRYTVYPIYHANHWTVMVYDSDTGDWKHYNSLRPRRGVRDEHYNEALKVWVSEHHNNFVKPRIRIQDVEAEDFNGKLTSVVDCPQQAPESSDCGIFVCFIIRQHIRGADVNNTMDGLTPTTMRAAMVEMFLSSPEKGLRAMAAKHMSSTPFFISNHNP
ncbi:hypothetical protein LOK49_LG06G02903 [Camellia lanceoleosa]|uniref:Uncharacterized protein n=1 Tax=Camellia lanceoleosa TaxID=1840588 RepID=A0ACC0HDA7_9ERIC|nr:hypothetical protein LOK49_LG06G02903 [Camellia lanceoleosa]